MKGTPKPGTIAIADGFRIRPDIFESHIEKTDTCWLWTGGQNRGYGQYSYGQAAHRIAYRYWVGSIPEGMTIDHLCFTPLCVNPAHLRLLSHQENSSNQRVAYQTHCKNGHEFTPENCYMRLGRGRRACRACAQASYRRRMDRKRAS